MSKALWSIIFVLMASLPLVAQAPMIVPSEVTVAGVRLKINGEAKKEIEETLDLLTRSQYHFQLKVDRTNLYMHFVEKVLKEEGIPEDFKYLAIQEGEFISDAVSASNAVGFWQFKKASAQELGVRVDDKVDERKHIIASTVGATKYLKRSNFVFDNWVLSMQSYLQGLTGTQRTVPDKWYGAKSMNITGKSHWYIKKFIAHKLAFQDFVGEGRKHPDVKLEAYEGKGMTLKQVSGRVGVDLDELKRFNKWLNQSTIPSDKSYKVIYPLKGNAKPIARKEPKSQDKKQSSNKTVPTSSKSGKSKNDKKSSNTTRRTTLAFRPITGNVGDYPRITGNRNAEYYSGQIKMNGIPAIRARKNETLVSLSKRTNTSIDKLRKFNDISATGNVRGEKYYYLKNKKSKGKVHYHVVQSGETLWGISQDYGIKLSKLLQKNRMTKTEELKIGRVLWLRFIRPEKIPIEYSNVKVVRKEVSAEDRLISEVSPARTVEAKVEKPKTKNIPVSKEPRKEEPKEELPKPKKALKIGKGDSLVIHRVQPKETFFAISRTYNVDIDDILDWNDIRVVDGLQIGQEIRLVLPKSQFAPKPATFVNHTVKAGETLWSISRIYGVKVEDLRGWNNKETNDLSPGEVLKVKQ